MKIARWTATALVALLVTIAAILTGFRVTATIRESGSLAPPGLFVAVPGGRAFVAVHGPRDGPVIMLVHGTAAWSGFWSDTAQALAAQGWRVLAVDVPPFGYSGHDPEQRYDRVSQARRLELIAASLADRPAVVLGHSFGAGAATELALRRPDLVKSLVLVDAALGAIDPLENADDSRLDGLIGAMHLRELLVAATVTNPLATGPLLRAMTERDEMAARWVPILQRPMRREGTTSAYAAWLPVLFASGDGALSRRSARLAAVRVPVSIIWGTADKITPIAQGERLAKLMHARAFIRLPEVGHIPHIEDPTGFQAALAEVLAPDGGDR